MAEMKKNAKNTVYIVGAGLSAGLGYPTIGNLLPKMWERLETAGLDGQLSKIIRFHHPNFNPRLIDTYPNIEQLLSEIDANAELFSSSRPVTGNFTSTQLATSKEELLLELATWFHEIQLDAIKNGGPKWLRSLIRRMHKEKAHIISFNWDLVLDQLLFEQGAKKENYGLGSQKPGTILLKPHGSLNWYRQIAGQHLKETKKITLAGKGSQRVYAFTEYRAPKSSVGRRYMPLIVPPTYFKQFRGELFRKIWQTTVSALSTASEVRFLGYSLPTSDLQVRFILRCGFHNQENGKLTSSGERATPTGRARVVIVDPSSSAHGRIQEVVGWNCEYEKATVEEWVNSDR